MRIFFFSPNSAHVNNMVPGAEKKRKVYDKYGKEGLTNNGGSRGSHHGMPGHQYPGFGSGFGSFDDPFFTNSGFSAFVFRNPEDVFKEFFGANDPFADFFGSHLHSHHHNLSSNRHNGKSGSPNRFSPTHRSKNGKPSKRSHHSNGHHHHRSSPSQLSRRDDLNHGPVGFGFGPFFGGLGLHSGFSDMFDGNGAGYGFSDSTTFSSVSSSSSAGSGSGIKKTSTSTRFVNGQKIETRK